MMRSSPLHVQVHHFDLAHRLGGAWLSIAAVGVLAAAGAASPPLSDAIQRVDPEEYSLKIEGRITAYQHDVKVEYQYDFNLENAPLVFPVVPDGGYHTVNLKKLKTTLELDDIAVLDQFELLPTTQLESRLGRFNIPKFKGNQIEFILDELVTCYGAKVDEKRLRAIPWGETWPPEVASALQPQMYVESTNESIVKLMNEWTKGKPKSAPPFVLGKELVRRTVGYFRPNGQDLVHDSNLDLAGFEINGAAHAAKTGRGPSHDGICLFVAVCRAAGLPARPVIGLDVREKREKPLSWAEFYVPSAGWIAVDFRELYSAPGRTHDIDQPWPGVGTNDDLNLLVPIAYHYHPPAMVRAAGREGKPLLWGWQPVPYVVPADQTLRFTVMKAPKRAGGG